MIDHIIDEVLKAEGGAVLPATPEGYTTVSIEGVGQVKIPYYNI